MSSLKGAFAAATHILKEYPIPIILLVLALHLVRNKFGLGLSKIPGPALASYTKLWRLNNVRKGQAHMTAINLHRKYGNLVRIAPKVVSVADPAMIPIIYNIKGNFPKSAFYPIQSINWKKKTQVNLFSNRDEATHREQNRKAASAYSMKNLLAMEYAVDSCSVLFMEKLRDSADKALPVDLGTWLQYYAFDVIGEFTFGKKFGFLEGGADVDGIMEMIKGMLVYAAVIGQIPEAHNVLLGNPAIPYIFPNMENWNAVVTFTLKAINAKTSLKRGGELELNQGEVGPDMLSRWAGVKQKDELKMSTREVVIHLSSNVFAGSDTTAIALRAAIYYLCKNPSTMRRLVDELDAAESRLSNPVTYKETASLPYLHAVLKEAMRIHPSVGLLLERHVPAGGATICGEYLPGGTIVGINAWVLHYNENIFPEPEKFIPERWLERDEEKLAEMEKSFFAFGAGTRTCIGKHISLIEMAKIIPQLLREFEVKLVDPEKEWVTNNVWFVQQKGLNCSLSKRQRKV